MIPRINIHTQPDDESCGPTSLHAVYQHFGDDISLQQVIKETKKILGGGTIAAHLANHALQRKYKATLYIYNLDMFDPTWFSNNIDPTLLFTKLHEQLKYKRSPKFEEATNAYLRFLDLGGTIQFKDLTTKLLRHYFERNIPIITGLSATYLYNCSRELTLEDGNTYYDDVKGNPAGHFVVLCGYSETRRTIVVADPHRANPLSQDNYYRVPRSRLINSIMLGILTYDATLLIIEPK